MITYQVIEKNSRPMNQQKEWKQTTSCNKNREDPKERRSRERSKVEYYTREGPKPHIIIEVKEHSQKRTLKDPRIS
jgi:hypothetical protein